MNKTLLVLGQTGQVARELADLDAPPGWTMIFRGRSQFDLAARAVGALLDDTAPDAVINAAAYTAVDRAESDPDAAFALNRDVPAALAKACAAAKTPLVHFSTDFVFDGTKAEPYVETDAVNPINVYGASKAAGEAAITSCGGVHAILRTSWVYSAHGSNFVKTMLRLAAERGAVNVVDDQTGRPTWAKDCAQAALAAILAMEGGRPLGVLHLAGDGDATWADLAAAVFDHLAETGRKRPYLHRISTADYPTPARRPANSRLDCGAIAAVLGWQARPWRYSLASCLAQIDRKP